jgi:hypothetical protein
MFPTKELLTLLAFARGQSPWSVEVFDAAIAVISYFGRMFLAQPQLIAGAQEDSDEDAIQAIESVTSGSDDHPVAGLSPAIASIILQFAIRCILRNLS